MSKAPPAEVSRLGTGICNDSIDFAEFRVALAIKAPGPGPSQDARRVEQPEDELGPSRMPVTLGCSQSMNLKMLSQKKSLPKSPALNHTQPTVTVGSP